MQMTALLRSRSMLLVICCVLSKIIPTRLPICKQDQDLCEFAGALIPNLTSAGRCPLYL